MNTKIQTINETVCTIFWKHFSLDFEFQYNHSVEKVVLFDLCDAELATLFRLEVAL
jgi:hypothetical protein